MISPHKNNQQYQKNKSILVCSDRNCDFRVEVTRYELYSMVTAVKPHNSKCISKIDWKEVDYKYVPFINCLQHTVDLQNYAARNKKVLEFNPRNINYQDYINLRKKMTGKSGAKLIVNIRKFAYVIILSL